MFDKVKCVYYQWRLSDTVRKCENELRTNCGPNATMEQCIDYLGRREASWLSDARINCLRDNKPGLFKKTLESCLKAGSNPFSTL